MRKIVIACVLAMLVPLINAQAQDNIQLETNVDETAALIESLPPDEYYKAVVQSVRTYGEREIATGQIEEYQDITVRITHGEETGDLVSLSLSGIVDVNPLQKVTAGDRIVVVKMYGLSGQASYAMADFDRTNALLWIGIFFVGLVVLLGRGKALGALLGLLLSIAVLAMFIVPRIMAGDNPILITTIGALGIIGVSLYLAHGFHKRTTLAMISTTVTLLVTIGLSLWFVDFANLFGRGSEEALFLQVGALSFVNLQGLLLAGIIIGTLGVLDDITTAQTAVVTELIRANPQLSKRAVYHRALNVGKEHISSLVNTLVLAYAGVSLPLFLLFTSYNTTPLWYALNGEFIAEEIVRTLLGSIALVCAVPISTAIAAYWISPKDAQDDQHTHSHSHSL